VAHVRVRLDVKGNRLGDVGVTSTETGTSWSDRLSPRNWSLAWKLVAVGLIPALLAIVLGVLRVADQAEAASELGAANRLLQARGQVADAATALRVERDRATAFLAEKRLGDRGPLQDAVRATDTAIEQIRTNIPAGELDTATRNAVEQAQGGFAQLAVLRADVDGTGPLLASDVTSRYSGVVARTDVLDRALLREVRTPEVAGLVDSLTAVTDASEAVALQHTVLGAALRAGTVSPADRATVNATDNALSAAYTEYQVALPTTQTPINFITSRANAERDASKLTILSAPVPGPISVTVSQWDDVSQRARERVDAAGADVRNALTATGEAAEARSSNLAGVNSVLLMLGLLLAATIVVLVARTLTRSLRVLRSSALDVAQRRLPQAVESMRAGAAPDVTVEPVPLTNRDEVGQVARAFDAVHGQALRLAADQAALQSNVSSMFVNLSRRSQGLVERQLQLIEQLESNEQDPDQLSNLFQLDHLATRMRRNSENLLVLAGTDFAKRNVAPVPLVDVLRAAVSEIEHYQRITVQAPPPATIVGRATSDIVHLLAELLDNATNFSPPDSQVVMSSTRTADGSILVEIADLGVGMLDSELADANRRLTTPSAVDVSASRRMGLFVVGRLGARHGITVHLGGAPMGGPGGGLTASVTLPAHLVVSAGDSPGSRSLRGDAALMPVGAPNGVPPQRAGAAGFAPRSAPRTPLAANGQAPVPAAAANGLPTRTPGSSLRREPAPFTSEMADSDSAGQPFGGGRPNDGAPGSQAPAAANGAEVAEATGADAVPTGAVPAVGAAAAGALRGDRGDRGADETADTPPAGQMHGSSTATPFRRPFPQAPASPAGTGNGARSGAGSTRGRSPGAGSPGPGSTGTGSSGTGRSRSGSSGAGSTRGGSSGAGSTAAFHGATATPPGAAAPDREATGPEAGAPQAAPASRDGSSRADSSRADSSRADNSRADNSRADGLRAEGAPADTRAATPTDDTADRADRTDSRAAVDASAADTAAGAAGAADTAAGAAGAADTAAAANTAAERVQAGGTASANGAQPVDGHADDHADADHADAGAAAADVSDGDVTPTERSAPSRPRPTPRGPNGTSHDISVPSTPYRAAGDGAAQDGAAQDGAAQDGAAQDGAADGTGRQDADPHGDELNGSGRYGGDQYGGDQYGRQYRDGRYGGRDGGFSPSTTPLPLVAGTNASAQSDPFAVPSGPGAPEADAADALFSASVPAIDEPDGLSRTRRPLAGMRQDPVDMAETTPIFEEIASAWFASERPVPVDWELGRRPGTEPEAEPAPAAATALDGPSFADDWPAASAAAPAASGAPPAAPVGAPPAQAFATVADEGWRAASGAAAERPDELTAAGLPKRRPRARLVPGSAGSAVLAAPAASPTRSAESIRGRLASYQQGVRQGREIRLRRDPGAAGSQPASPEENVVAPAGGEHDEENR
jgi:signal transduction histidine kinase